VQVDPVKPTLKVPESMLLKLRHDRPLSNFAFNFCLRHYIQEKDGLDYAAVTVQLAGGERVPFLFTLKEFSGKGNTSQFGGRGLHSSTSQLNLSRLWH